MTHTKTQQYKTRPAKNLVDSFTYLWTDWEIAFSKTNDTKVMWSSPSNQSFDHKHKKTNVLGNRFVNT